MIGEGVTTKLLGAILGNKPKKVGKHWASKLSSVTITLEGVALAMRRGGLLTIVTIIYM